MAGWGSRSEPISKGINEMKIVTVEEAFAPVPGEVSIPIDMTQHDFQFTRMWFRNRNQSTWSTFLKPKFTGLRTSWPIRMIQIGVFEGQDLVWCLQNILTHPDSHVIAIDPWAATTKLDQAYMDAVQARARHNLSPWKDKVDLIHDYSDRGCLETLSKGRFHEACDLAVIDGDHNAPAVVSDAIYCYELLKNGGWMIFDDVRNRIPKPDHVVHGIEKFLSPASYQYQDKMKFEWAHRYCDCYSKI